MSVRASDRALVLAKQIIATGMPQPDFFDGDASKMFDAIAILIEVELRDAEHRGFVAAIDLLKIREKTIWPP